MKSIIMLLHFLQSHILLHEFHMLLLVNELHTSELLFAALILLLLELHIMLLEL